MFVAQAVSNTANANKTTKRSVTIIGCERLSFSTPNPRERATGQGASQNLYTGLAGNSLSVK
jgi:hypothetical protein